MEKLDGHHAMAIAVALADAYKGGSENSAVMLAVDKAQLVPADSLSSSPHLGLLWKCAAACPDKIAFVKVEFLLKQMDGSFLKSVVESLSKCVDDASPAAQRAAFASLVSLRCRWLEAEISHLDKPFTWEMPGLQFPANNDVEAFLHSKEPTFTVRCFLGIVAARKFVSDHSLSQGEPIAPSTMTAHGTGRNAAVQMTKTSACYEELRRKVQQLQAELAWLSQNYP